MTDKTYTLGEMKALAKMDPETICNSTLRNHINNLRAALRQTLPAAERLERVAILAEQLSCRCRPDYEYVCLRCGIFKAACGDEPEDGKGE